MALEALLGQKRQGEPCIAGTYGARRVRVLGSVALGDTLRDPVRPDRP
jgi:hypothetical protein